VHSTLNASLIAALISADLAWMVSGVLAVGLLVFLIQHEIMNAGGARLALVARHSLVAIVPLAMLFIVNVAPRLATALAR
jgi:uncharacterized membrane-anchored protein YitT (DUF2179 family)